jgi:O-antigen ligase
MVNWQAAWGMYLADPWFGIGLGNFGPRYGDFVPVKDWPNLTGHAHNYYLTLLGETGVVGLAGYFLFLGSAFGIAIAAVRRSRSVPWARPVAVGVLASLVAHAVHNGFDSLYVQGMATLLALMLGLAAALPGERQTLRA